MQLLMFMYGDTPPNLLGITIYIKGFCELKPEE